MFPTEIPYDGVCIANSTCLDDSTDCFGGRCLCDPRHYRNRTSSACASIADLKPLNVHKDTVGTKNFNLQWTQPVNDGYVTGYRVDVKPIDTNDPDPPPQNATGPPISVQGLQPGTQYDVTVSSMIQYAGRVEYAPAAKIKISTKPETVVSLNEGHSNLTFPTITIAFRPVSKRFTSYTLNLEGKNGYNKTETATTNIVFGKTFYRAQFSGVVAGEYYNLTIITVSGTVKSEPFIQRIRIMAAQAGTVNHLKKLALTSRSVSVSWKRPEKTNGDLFEYRLEVLNRTCKQLIVFNCTECKRNTWVEARGNCEHTTVVPISASDFNNPTHVVNYTITGLLPDTTYVVKVAAYTQEGRGMERSLSETTDEEAASKPTAFTANNKTSDTITLTWAPPEPRPGRTHYNIRVYEKIENTPDYNYIGTKNITGYPHNMYTVTNLSSAWEYKFYIEAFTQEGGSGNVPSGVVTTEESEFTGVSQLQLDAFSIESGLYVNVAKRYVSSFDQTILSVRRGGGSLGTNVIPLEICAECLHNAVNGNIVKSGLLVCKVGDCQIRNKIHDARGDSYDRLPNWHSARGSGFTSMYRATADDWMSGKERDAIVLYTVGGETCEIADQTRFCNGPLLTENSYRVWVFACTNVGCMETLFVEVAVTEAYDVGAVVGGDVGAVVGGVVGVIVFAVIVFVAVVVYVKVKRKSRSKKNQDSINLGPAQTFDDTYDEVGDGQRMHVIRESSSNDGGYVNQASGHSPDGFDSTYEQLATYQNAEIHDYGQMNVKTRNKRAKNKR